VDDAQQPSLDIGGISMSARSLLGHGSAQVAAAFAAFALAAASFACAPSSVSALPQISSRHFQSADTCICHGQEQSDWGKSMHSKAIVDPVFLLERGYAGTDSKGALVAFCNTCHTPIGTMAGEGGAGHALSAQGKQGVACDFCHQVTGTKEPIGGASQTLNANGTKRAQFSDAWSPVHATAGSKFHATGEFCGACHTLRHPTSGVVLDTTYLDWKASPYSKLGIVCQDCHMSLTPHGGPSTGQAASFGPLRDRIYQMTFVAANVPLGNAPVAIQILRSAAKVTIQVPDVIERGTTSKVKVTVTNVGAGHGIPGGVAEIREMWLEVNVVSADGTRKLIGRRQFGRVFSDAEGHYPAQLWQAAAVQSDDRIPPKGSVRSEYPVTMDSETTITVEAVLNYRSFPEGLAKGARVANPVTEMARVSTTVYGSRSAQQGARRATEGIWSWARWLAAAIVAALIAVLTVLVVRRSRRSHPDPAG
jgi:hypothetical protein